MYLGKSRSHLALVALNVVFCVIFLELLSVASSWKISKKCPYGHYYNDGCVTCWCDINTGHTNCQRSSSCTRVNVKCPNGKEYKDECGNNCNCHEETGAVYCNNNNPQCPKKKPSLNKEDLENAKSTTSKPIIPKIHVPVLTPVKNNLEVYQPVILRRAATLVKKPLPIYMDYSSANIAPPIISLYEKIRRLMSKKIKETIDDVIKDELTKPLGKIFQQSFSTPALIANSNSRVSYPTSGNVLPTSTSYFSEKIKNTVSETIEDDIPKSVSSNIHEVFVKAPSEVNEEAKKSRLRLNYNEKSDDLKDGYIREPLFNLEGSESRKVFTFAHPHSSSSASASTLRPMLSNFEERMKPNLGNSFHNTSPKPFSYNTFQVNSQPSFSYEESSTPRAVTMNFPESSPTRSPSFTFERSSPRINLGEEVHHQSTSGQRIYNITILSTPRPYLYDNQGNSPKPIIREFVQSTTPHYSNFQYGTPKQEFLGSMVSASTPRPNYHPSIYDFEGNSQKYKNIYDKSHHRHNHLHQSYLHESSTPSSILYDSPHSTPKPFNPNFIHTPPKAMQQYNFHSQKPIIRLIFQQSTSKPPSFVVRNHHTRFSTNKPVNSNYLRTTSIADPSRFTFHQMTTKRPSPLMRLRPTTHQLYRPHLNNYDSHRPSFTNVAPVISSSPNMQVNKGSSVVYIFHERIPRPQNNNHFHRQPLLQNPSSVVHHYIPPPTRVPINFLSNTPKSNIIMTTTRSPYIRKDPTTRSQSFFEMTSMANPVTASYNFEHLSPNPLAHRLEDEIPKPMDFNFQEENVPEHVSFNVKPTMVSKQNTQTRKPVILKYKNWVSAASTPVPTTVKPPTSATTTRSRTHRPKPIRTGEPVDFTYPPPRANSEPAIKIHNHGTRTDNTEFDYNSPKTDNGNSPINYDGNSNEGVSASSVSPVVNYDYRAETRTAASSPEQEEEINHEEMIPKELILDPQSGPMTVIFDHDNGQESLKFSDRKGNDPLVTLSQDSYMNPIEVDIDKISKKPEKVDLEEILEKSPEEEYKPLLVDLEKEQRERTPIVKIKSETGNTNINEYSQQDSQKEPIITYYDSEDNFGEKQVEDIPLTVTPSDIIAYEQDEPFVDKENYEIIENSERTVSDATEDQLENTYRVQPLNYDGEDQPANQEEQPQETQLHEYDQEQQPKEYLSEIAETNQFTDSEIIPMNDGYNEENSYDNTQLDSSSPEINVTPINFDFPNLDQETTPTPNFYDEQGESSYNHATENNYYHNQHQFMHKSGEELLSQLPIVENKGEILRFKFNKDEKISKKPLLVSFKKQGRPYRASAYLKTDAVADVFSFYHKMRHESAKRAVAAAEKRRLEVPSDERSTSPDFYFSTRSTGSGSSSKKESSRQSTDNGTKKVSRGTTTADNNSKKLSRIHSKDFAETLKKESISNERSSVRERSDRHNNRHDDMASKLDWKLEIEV